MLINRQKCVLYILKQLQRCNKIQLVKLLFLLRNESKISSLCPFYSFLPYKYGPYSFEIFHDIDMLEKEKYISQKKDTISYENNKNKIPYALKNNIDKLLSKYESMDYKNLIKYVYDHYPQYTIFSEINKRQNYIRDQKGIITIGYQGKSIDEFLHILINEKINSLIDIRYNPWSMKYGYKKYQLEALIDKINIKYINIPELGISHELRKNLENKEDYINLLREYSKELHLKEKQLNFLKEISKTQKIALMCFEKNPKICHRSIIGKRLQNMGAEVTLH